MRVALLERRPAPPWLQDLVDGIIDKGGEGDGTSGGKTTTVESWQCQRRQLVEGRRPGLRQRCVVHEALGGGSPPFPVPPAFASALNHHLCQSPGVNLPLLPYLDRGAPLPPPTTLLFSAIAGELNSLLCTANATLTMGTWTKSPAHDHFRMPPRLVRVVDLIIGFDPSMSHVAMTSAAGGPGGAQWGGGSSRPLPCFCRRRRIATNALPRWSVGQ